MTPLFTRALRPAAAAAAPDSMLIHHCGRHPSSFLLLTPPHTSPLCHLLPIAHVLHPTGQSILASRSWNPIFFSPCVNLTYLSACIEPSSIFNTQLVLRILSYGGSAGVCAAVAMAATWKDRRDNAGADGACCCCFDRERGSDLRRFHMCAAVNVPQISGPQLCHPLTTSSAFSSQGLYFSNRCWVIRTVEKHESINCLQRGEDEEEGKEGKEE